MLESMLAVLLVVYVFICLFVCIGLLMLKRSRSITQDFPTVSILISCRNEEIDLPACIRSIEKINYPQDKYEVILIDDQSTDRTGQILAEAAEKNKNIQFYSYKDFEDTHLKAKARGIARAASKASSEWLFITDADGQIPPNWLKNMLYGVNENTGMIVGMTETINTDLLSTLEKTAGIFTLPFAFGFAGWGIKLIGLGPNMAIRHDVYRDAGGLENADFAVAEDMALFKMAKTRNYDINYHADKDTTIKLAPVPSFNHLLSQQRRWLRGGFQGGFADWVVFMILFSIAMSFSTFYFLNWFMNVQLAVITTCTLLIAQFILLGGVKIRTKSSGILRLVPLSVAYTLVGFIWLPLSFIFNRKIRWIGENYEVKYE